MQRSILVLPLLAALAGCLDETTQHQLQQGLALAEQGVKLAKTLQTAAEAIGDAPSGPAADVAVDTRTVSGSKAVGQRNFANAKKILPTVYLGMEQEFYCGCDYSGKTVDFASCGFVPRKNPERASRIEWEHVVPAWVLGHQRQCWQNGGRKNCTDTDPVFAVAEGDLINLVPAVGEVNGDRSNFPYSAWTRQPEPIYGQCQTIIDFRARKVQPREEVRGRIARINLYMHETYGLSMSRQDRQLMCAWARTYPVDDWETARDVRIARFQGHGNPFVSEAGRVETACEGV